MVCNIRMDSILQAKKDATENEQEDEDEAEKVDEEEDREEDADDAEEVDEEEYARRLYLNTMSHIDQVNSQILTYRYNHRLRHSSSFS